MFFNTGAGFGLRACGVFGSVLGSGGEGGFDTYSPVVMEAGAEDFEAVGIQGLRFRCEEVGFFLSGYEPSHVCFADSTGILSHTDTQGLE